MNRLRCMKERRSGLSLSVGSGDMSRAESPDDTRWCGDRLFLRFSGLFLFSLHSLPSTVQNYSTSQSARRGDIGLTPDASTEAGWGDAVAEERGVERAGHEIKTKERV